MKQPLSDFVAFALVTVLLVVAGLRAAEAPASPEAARATVEKTFGAQIRQVQATAATDDDLQTAGVLLQASQDASTAPAVRAELARRAMELAMAVPATRGASLAELALSRWAELGQLTQVQRKTWLVRIRQAELRRARRGQRIEPAARLVEALRELASAQEAAGCIDLAARAVLQAAGIARQERLTDLEADLAPVARRLQRELAFRREMDRAKRRLEAAVAGENPPAIRDAYEKIGLLYLLRKGDPAAAVEALTKAGHEWAGPAEYIRKRAAGKRLTTQESLASVEMLRKAADRAELSAKARLLELLVDICDEVAEDLQSGSAEAARVEMLRQQARAILMTLPDSRAQSLRRALRGLAGKVRIDVDGTVRLAYPFQSPKELSDWSLAGGKWDVADGTLKPGKGHGGIICNNVRFRADRPLHVSFSGTGRGSVNLVLALNDDLSSIWRGAYFILGLKGTRGYVLGGLGAPRLIGNEIIGTRPFHVLVEHDGRGRMTCTVNGKLIGELHTRVRLVGNQLRVGFSTRRGSGVYRDLVIRGTPIAKHPVAPKSDKLATPRSRRPPRKTRGRRRGPRRR